MNAAARHPLYEVKALIEDVVRDDDTARLAECLSGQHLPALGGNPHPADVLHRAVSLPPYDPDLPKSLAGLTATLCERRARTLAGAVETVSVAVAGGDVVTIGSPAAAPLEDETYVFNLLLLSSYLPADAELFDALMAFHDIGLRTEVLATGTGRVERQLRQALTYQQVDDRLEGHWLGLIDQSAAKMGRLTAENKADLLDAWTGLLWIPPSPAEREAGKTLAVDRLAHALPELFKAAGETDGLPILRFAVRQLSEAYPRSPEFWADELSAHVAQWPEMLRDVAAEQWPLLELEDGVAKHLSEDATIVWEALKPDERSRIEKAAVAGDRQRWESLWPGLYLLPPGAGISRAQWRQRLQRIRFAFEERYPDLLSEVEEQPSLEELAAEERDRSPDRSAKAHTRRIDRLRSYERVTKVLADVEERLRNNDLSRAKKYLAELARRQDEEGTESELIVKTLCNAAATALELGFGDWAKELYEGAIARGVNDPVPHTGLAETLKAGEKLEEAESIYRRTIARWPNDVVAHTGLAETLKAGEKLEEAESIYRRTIARWPNNVFAHTGLAETLKAGEKLEEAESIYRQSIARWPNDVVAHNGLAETLKAGEKLEEAESIYRQSIARWPNNVVARNGLAETLKAREKLEEAENIYRRTIARWPNNRIARHGLANVLRKRRHFDQALDLLPDPGELVSLQDHYDLHLRGMILLESGDLQDAIALFKRARSAARSKKRRAIAHSALVMARLKQQRYRDAQRELSAATESTPEIETLRLHTTAGLGDTEQAKALHSELTAKILTFHAPVRSSIRCITDAFGLAAESDLRQPTREQLDHVLDAEAEMLLAA